MTLPLCPACGVPLRTVRDPLEQLRALTKPPYPELGCPGCGDVYAERAESAQRYVRVRRGDEPVKEFRG